MKCTNPKIKDLVRLYQFGTLTEEQTICVEAHLMECQACMAELFHASPILEIFEENPDQFLEALEPELTWWRWLKQFFIEKLESFSEILLSIFSPIYALGRNPAIRLLVSAVAVALIVMLLLPKSSVDYSDLATIAKAPYLGLRLRQPGIETQSKKLFEFAMASYQSDQYDATIPQLDSLLTIKPDHAEGKFYLGVSLLLTENIKDGIQRLKEASLLSQQQENKILLSRCYWYLGNAFLKLNDEKQARENFQYVVLLDTVYIDEAKDQLNRIEQRKKNQK